MAAQGGGPSELEKEQVRASHRIASILVIVAFDFEFVPRLIHCGLRDADVRDGGEGDGVQGRSLQPVSDAALSCLPVLRARLCGIGSIVVFCLCSYSEILLSGT
jgi:hypothetical protein